MWKIEYDNDTGPYDEYFYEWWDVSNDKYSFKAESEEEAKWLLDVLINHKEIVV